MNLYSNYPHHDFPRNWTALDLADAIPLRLSERISLGLVKFAVAPVAAKNALVAAPTVWRRRDYAGKAETDSFRVR